MSDEDYNSNVSKYQSSPNKEHSYEDEHFENEEEEVDIDRDYDEAYENTDSLRASSVTMNFSISKTGNFEEHFDLPPPKYDKVIEEHPEENEDSKYQQPTKEELDLQNERIKKAREALIKIKKAEIASKKKKSGNLIVADKPKWNQAKVKSATSLKMKKDVDVQKKKKNEQDKGETPKDTGKKPVKQDQSTGFFKEENKDTGTFAFRVEGPVKATQEAPSFNPSPETKLRPPPLKIESTTSQDARAKKREEQIKIDEDHKKNLENLGSIFSDKRKKAENDAKKMQDMQKKLLEKERNYKPPNQEPDKVKTIPNAPPAPKPRSLNPEGYKLHQLAENTGNKDSRLTADKISGSMLQAIKILSTKISEEFPYFEILEEEKRLIQCEKILLTGKEMKRSEVDYHEETKKKILEYKKLIEEHKILVEKKDDFIKQQEQLNEKIKKLEPMKAIIKLGEGKYLRAGMLPDGLVDTIEELNSVGSEVMKENPVDVVVEKIEKQGSTLRDLFNQIDFDGDKILTIGEIKTGLATVQIKLTNDDKDLLIKTLDSNSDGVVSEEEFFKILDPKMRVQKEYRAIVGNSDINNPIIFEEQILDMKFKGRMLQKEIPKLNNQLKGKIDTEKKLLMRIKNMEKILESRNIQITGFDKHDEIISKIKEAEDKKNQAFQVCTTEKSSYAMKVTALQEKIIDLNRQKAIVSADYENKKNSYVTVKRRDDFMSKKEETLDKENRFIAIIMIQRRVKGVLARIRYRKEKQKVEGALKVIVPAMRSYVDNQKNKRQALKTPSPEPTIPEPPIPEKQLSPTISISSYGMDHIQEICKIKADRLCLTCRRESCPKCFTDCRNEGHNFGLLNSRKMTLNLAEKEFIEILKILQNSNNFNLTTYLMFEVPQIKPGKIYYNLLKNKLTTFGASLENFTIQNLMTLSEKCLDEDNFVDLETYCRILNS